MLGIIYYYDSLKKHMELTWIWGFLSSFINENFGYLCQT